MDTAILTIEEVGDTGDVRRDLQSLNLMHTDTTDMDTGHTTDLTMDSGVSISTNLGGPDLTTTDHINTRHDTPDLTISTGGPDNPALVGQIWWWQNQRRRRIKT